MDLPAGFHTGRVISIDPSVGHMGWAVHDVEYNNGEKHVELTKYGTIFTRKSGVVGSSETADRLMAILNEEKPDLMVIEDYQFIPGKTKGMYVVPGMIMLVQYLWYKMTGETAIVVPAGEWKQLIVGSRSADKATIKAALQRILSPEIVSAITEKYASVRKGNSGDFGEQDCYDAIGIGLYIAQRMINNGITEELMNAEDR